MVVAGPGSLREQHDFPDEATLEGYQIALADRLATAGWLLWGQGRDRRNGRDRRAAPRATRDRRSIAASGGLL
jgi:hypothetical protein